MGRRMRWAGRLACMIEKWKACRDNVGKTERRRLLGNRTRIWEHNI